MTRQTISKIEKIQESIFKKSGKELEVTLTVRRGRSPEYSVSCSTASEVMYELPTIEYIQFEEKLLLEHIYALENTVNEGLEFNNEEEE